MDLRISVFQGALDAVGRTGPSPKHKIGDVPVEDGPLRDALEAAYREKAALAPSRDERIALVDQANSVRRWTAW